MIGLHRELAPISDESWKRIDQEVRDVLSLHLAGRKLVDFDGPHGWDHSAIDLGGVTRLEGSPGGTQVCQRMLRPLIELRVGFELDREELERIDRGARRVELQAAAEAAKLFAAAEDSALFEGYADADLPGLMTDAEHDPIPLPEHGSELLDSVSTALERLRRAGVGGPYAMALGGDAYASLHADTGDGGYPIVKHIGRLLDGPLVWAPALQGGVVLSLRGGDYRMVCGRDASVGYAGHDDKQLRLYIEESFSAEFSGPEAAVALVADDVR